MQTRGITTHTQKMLMELIFLFQMSNPQTLGHGPPMGQGVFLESDLNVFFEVFHMLYCLFFLIGVI